MKIVFFANQPWEYLTHEARIEEYCRAFNAMRFSPKGQAEPESDNIAGKVCLGLVSPNFTALPPEHRPLWPDVDQIVKANAYHKTETFRKHAGRTVHRVPVGLRAISRAYEQLGCRRAFVKFSAFKTIPNVVLQEKLSTKQVHERMARAYRPQEMMLYRKGREKILVQPFIPMHHEYRVFVVDGQPVTGAGCIARFTPIDSLVPFDCRTETLRGKGDIAENTDIVANYLTFAQPVCAAFQKEGLLDYAMDLFMDEKGNPGIVEINALPNAGFYASQPTLLTSSIMETIRKRHGVALKESLRPSLTLPPALEDKELPFGLKPRDIMVALHQKEVVNFFLEEKRYQPPQIKHRQAFTKLSRR